MMPALTTTRRQWLFSLSLLPVMAMQIIASGQVLWMAITAIGLTVATRTAFKLSSLHVPADMSADLGSALLAVLLWPHPSILAGLVVAQAALRGLSGRQAPFSTAAFAVLLAALWPLHTTTLPVPTSIAPAIIAAACATPLLILRATPWTLVVPAWLILIGGTYTLAHALPVPLAVITGAWMLGDTRGAPMMARPLWVIATSSLALGLTQFLQPALALSIAMLAGNLASLQLEPALLQRRLKSRHTA
ncbi:hypothetical protein KSF73_04340 [Burkholderiaceae bacterium DAT-1]|nr:hypothetical protein [Burkholderiaceae bacterium DAT-1]